MNLLTRALSAVGLERRSTNPNDMWEHFRALRGSSINGDTAQGVSACYAAVQAISEAIATLPLHLYKEDKDSRVKAKGHPLYKVLHSEANPEQSALSFREYMTSAVLLRGNAFARLVFGSDGQVREMWPLDPDRVRVIRLKSGALAYECTLEGGTVARYLDGEILHLRHRLGPDGVMGQGPIQLARGVFELAVNELDHGRDTFKNGAKLLGVLEVPTKLNPDQKASIKEGWRANASGQTPVLENGASYKPLSMTLADAEWIESRRFTVEEVARLFRCPAPILGHLQDSNYSNSSEMARWFITHTLARWMTMWEQEISRKCLTEAGRRIYWAEFSAEGMMRGDSLNRAQFYQRGIEDGWLLKSEARALENLPAIEGIDEVSNGKAQDAKAQAPNA